MILEEPIRCKHGKTLEEDCVGCEIASEKMCLSSALREARQARKRIAELKEAMTQAGDR